MRIEFNTPEEFEMFKRVMDRVHGDGMGAGNEADGAFGFNLGQEQELLHKPEVGATRFSHETPILEASNSDAGFPYGEQWAFGLAFAGDTVSVYNATVERYPSRYEAADNPTDIVMDTAGDAWIGYLFDSEQEDDADKLTVTGPHTEEPVTSDQDVIDGKYRGPLFKFTVTDDGAETPAVTSVVLTRDYVHGRMDIQITTE